MRSKQSYRTTFYPLHCDFGLPQIPAASHSYAQGSSKNTSGDKLVLEIREESARQSKQTDVWAFGMTVYVCSA